MGNERCYIVILRFRSRDREDILALTVRVIAGSGRQDLERSSRSKLFRELFHRSPVSQTRESFPWKLV